MVYERVPYLLSQRALRPGLAALPSCRWLLAQQSITVGISRGLVAAVTRGVQVTLQTDATTEMRRNSCRRGIIP